MLPRIIISVNFAFSTLKSTFFEIHEIEGEMLIGFKIKVEAEYYYSRINYNSHIYRFKYVIDEMVKFTKSDCKLCIKVKNCIMPYVDCFYVNKTLIYLNIMKRFSSLYLIWYGFHILFGCSLVSWFSWSLVFYFSLFSHFQFPYKNSHFCGKDFNVKRQMKNNKK